MEKEKIAAIVLIIIIVGSLFTFLIASNYSDVLNNLFPSKVDESIQIGDCCDVNYIGSFKSNGTVFDTSYENVSKEWGLYDANRTYSPLKIFVDPNGELAPPEEYKNYTSNMIKGFLTGLIGMKEGENKTIVIPPEDAYGIWNETLAEENGMDSIPLDSMIKYVNVENKSAFKHYFPDVNLTVNETFDYGKIALQTENILNATIINVTDDNVTFKLIEPVNGTVFKQPILNCNSTLILVNDTMFKIHLNLEVGHTFSFSFYGALYFKVVDVNETHAKLAMNMGAPSINLVGQTLLFKVEVMKVYKTSLEIKD